MTIAVRHRLFAPTAAMKKLSYHVNPVIRKRQAQRALFCSKAAAVARHHDTPKACLHLALVSCREEELHLKNMEAKIRAAKSTLPGAKNRGEADHAGVGRTLCTCFRSACGKWEGKCP